jgi:hypothetical protein
MATIGTMSFEAAFLKSKISADVCGFKLNANPSPKSMLS